MHNDPPRQFFRLIGTAVEHAMNRQLADHVAEYHRKPPGCGPGKAPLKAIPFRRLHIPGPELERIVERLETEDTADLLSIARDFGYPLSLLERELADHWGAWRAELRRRAVG